MIALYTFKLPSISFEFHAHASPQNYNPFQALRIPNRFKAFIIEVFANCSKQVRSQKFEISNFYKGLEFQNVLEAFTIQTFLEG